MNRAELRKELDDYRTKVAELAYENAQLRRHLREVLLKIGNTEDFLAVLQGEQINHTTEPN